MNSRIKAVLRLIKKAFCSLKPMMEAVSQLECSVASAWSRSAHRRLMTVQWTIPPEPENFDHHIDLFYLWLQSRNPQWVERGVYGALSLKGGRVLELCCGDGFNSRNFYSLTSESVVACDFDPLILKTANRKNRAPNVTFIQADIRTNMPTGVYQNIVWDAAMEHFTPGEIDAIMKNIKARLSCDGIVSGYTVVKKGAEDKHLSHHEYEFKDKEDLRRFFTPYFKNVVVFETIYPGRHNLYFWASDAEVPFSPSWNRVCSAWASETAKTLDA